MATRKRFILIGAGILLLVIVVALVSIPHFLNADSFRTRIESTLSTAVGRKVTLGKLELSLWSGSLVAQNAAVADDPAFSSRPFLQASQVRIGIEILPLIFGQQIHIEGFDLAEPQITLLHASNGTWNYSSLGAGAAKTPAAKKESGGMIPNLTVAHVDVTGGRLTVALAPAEGAGSQAIRVYNGLDLRVTNFSFEKSFSFTASALLPDAGSVSIHGTAGPVNPQDASLTPFAVHLELKHLNPGAAGVLDASSGVTGLTGGITVDATWSGHLLHVAKLLIDSPNLLIARPATPTPPAPAAAPDSNSMIATLSVDSLEVKNGVITVAASGQPASTAVYRQVNLTVSNYSPKTSSPFNLSAQLPRGGSLNVSGNAGPFNQQNAARTPIDAEISLKHVDIAASGLIAPGSGIGGLMNLDAKATSDGQTLNSNGVAHVEGLRLAKNATSSSQPVDVRFAATRNMQSQAGQLQHSTVTIGSGAVINVVGTYQPTGAATQVSLKVDAPGLMIDQIQAFLPSLGIKLPPGSRLQGGTLTASLNVTGPTNNPVISGPVRLDNTQLAGFDLGSALSSIAPLTGLHPGSGTVIRSLSLNLYAANGSIRTDNVVLVVPALGSATGSGTIAASGALNYHVNLKPAALSGGGAGAAEAGGVASQLMGMVPGGAGKVVGALPANMLKNGIPLAIAGTTSSPTFTPSFLGGGGNSPGTSSKGQTPGNSVGNALGGLLKGPR